jgi:hypothetical protein
MFDAATTATDNGPGGTTQQERRRRRCAYLRPGAALPEGTVSELALLAPRPELAERCHWCRKKGRLHPGRLKVTRAQASDHSKRTEGAQVVCCHVNVNLLSGLRMMPCSRFT